MDARGYGRTGTATRRQRFETGALMLLALFLLTVGAYAFLDATAPRVLALPALGAGVLLAGAAMWAAGRRVERTRYRPQPWLVPETLTVLSGVVVAVGVGAVDRIDPYAAIPGLDAWPSVPLWLVPVVLVGALPALLTPAPAAVVRPERKEGVHAHAA
jgi:energy-coupling factor transport system permease protein